MWEPAACALSDSRFPLGRQRDRCLLKIRHDRRLCERERVGRQEKDPRADPLIYSLTTARIAFK